MKKYSVQPLDLMQFINTKYHEPFIRERIELEGQFDANRLADSPDKLIGVFPVLKCRYDEKENAFTEIADLTGKDLLKIDNNAALFQCTESEREKAVQIINSVALEILSFAK